MNNKDLLYCLLCINYKILQVYTKDNNMTTYYIKDDTSLCTLL